MTTLTPREQLVVTLLEAEGLTLAAAAKRVGATWFPLVGREKVSRERVRQIYEKARRKRAVVWRPWETYEL